jgi:hypothetical protein
MSAQENIALARRFLAEEDKRGVVPEELCAPGFTALIAGFPPMDLAGVTQLAKVFYGAFPNIKQTVEDAVADEEKAAVRFSATGTHTGDLMGMPPTGKQVYVCKRNAAGLGSVIASYPRNSVRLELQGHQLHVGNDQTSYVPPGRQQSATEVVHAANAPG